MKRVYYHVRNELPVYVRYRIQDAWGWCMGMIQRDMWWEVGGGFRIGSLYTPVEDSCQCMAKPIQYCKLKKIIKKNKVRKGNGTRDQIANIRWIIEKTRAFQKNIYFCFIDYAKTFDCVDHQKPVENSERDGNTRPPDLPLEKFVYRSGGNS